MSRRLTPNSVREWGTALLTWFGMAGLTACTVIWAVTPDHIIAPSLVGTFLALLGGGLGGRILAELREPPEPPIPPGSPSHLAVEAKQEES